MNAEKTIKGSKNFDERKGSTSALPGIKRYMKEISRVSYSPGMTQWCTPGHNRSAALRLASRKARH